MIKHIKISLFFIIGVIVIMLSLSIHRIMPLLGSNGIFMPSEKKAEKILEKDLDELAYISKVLSDFGSEYISWTSLYPDMLTYYDEKTEKYMPLKNDTIFQKIADIQETKIEKIEKNGNYILFIVWSSLDSSCGILYCKNDAPNIAESGKTYVTKMHEENWYYYKHLSD